MKITLHCYIINYYLTQWTDNRMPDKRGADNRGSTVLRQMSKFVLTIKTYYKRFVIKYTSIMNENNLSWTVL